jgi:hypothetical protein
LWQQESSHAVAPPEQSKAADGQSAFAVADQQRMIEAPTRWQPASAAAVASLVEDHVKALYLQVLLAGDFLCGCWL